MSVININSTQEFNDIVNKSDKTVVVDFWAEWCGPCRIQGPILDELSNKNPDDVVIAKVNVDNLQELSANYGISSIPTMMVFNKGERYGTPLVGVTHLDRLETIVNHLKK
jgi:thioredoxin 1